MSIIYFDICAIPLFLMILFVCHSRKMTKGNANRLFITVVLISLFSTVADLFMEITSNSIPLSHTELIICNISTYIYLLLRNATNAVLLLFLLTLTRTEFLLRKKWAKAAFALPYAFIVLLLAQNPFTNNAFTITAQEGYTRGPLMMVFYGVALIYGIVGFAYCIYCRRYLPANKWGALLSIYVLVHVSVLVQFLYPDLLLEMFCTAVGEMLIMLTVMRPEERMDTEAGMLSWVSYQSDLQNIIRSGEHVQIIAIRIPNSQNIRIYLGDHYFNICISEIASEICALNWKHNNSVELYYERPGNIYLITDADETGTGVAGEQLLSELSDRIRYYMEKAFHFEPQICLIRCPEDLQKAEDIISLGHKFYSIDGRNQTIYRASEIVHSRDFAIEAHIEEILERAIREKHVVMYY